MDVSTVRSLSHAPCAATFLVQGSRFLMAAAMCDVDAPGKSINLPDLAKRVTPCAVDNDGTGFYSRFMEKIFSI